jgi:hypothetical protein
MDIQKEHSIFAEAIARELIDELTGDNINYLSGKVPEEKFIVGQLSPKSENTEFLSSRTIINAVGLNFNIEKEKLNDCELDIRLCGNLFYRVFPPYEEVCQAMVQEYNKMFGKDYLSLEEFLKDDTLKDQFWDEKKAKPNPDCKMSMLNAYRKISLEDYGIHVSLKLSEIYDQEHLIGVVDDSSAINCQLTKTINDIIENFVLNQDDYYSYEVREKISIYDMSSRDSWDDFLARSKKDTKLIPNWDMSVNCEVREIGGLINIDIKFANKAQQLESELKQRHQKEHTRISTIFNARLMVEIINAEYVPIKLDYFKDDYKYDKTQPAVGFNCNIDFEDLHETKDYLATTNVPIFRQYRLKTNNKIPARFSDLIDNPVKALNKILDGMKMVLSDWKNDYVSKQKELSSQALQNMENEIGDFELEINRFEIGISLIEDYSIIRDAFVKMNQAFMNSPKSYGGWRLFQVVYIVSVILDIAITEKNIDWPANIKEKSTFDNVDIIYFPTGGGKTEAFLGTVVFTLFYDRLRGKDKGVSAIIRYPLRLLAAQQASRVANILAQAEMIRRDSKEMVGSDEFAMGYLCGEGNTPNKIDEFGMKEIEALSQEERDRRFLVVEKCPYCGEDLHVFGDVDNLRLVHCCGNPNCSEKILPIYIVDAEIYRYLPSVIISTVDKMAAIGYNRNFPAIYRGATHICKKHGYCGDSECIVGKQCKEERFDPVSFYDPVPTLLIQDELHLIRESLGTYDSHYETFTDYFCKHHTSSLRGMKVIGATATISNYEQQVEELFLKNPRRFPCESINLKKHFYHYIDENELNRIIIGYAPFGRAVVNGVVYSMKDIRTVIWKYVLNPELVLKLKGLEGISLEEAKKLAQDYWMLIEYNNVKIDSQNVIGALHNPINIELSDENVKTYVPAKMTGDDTFQEVRKTLALIENANDIVEDLDFNMISATSMISHGVDADRFNEIMFFGMPGSTAEYIQAYSRAGRKYPGIVVDIIRPSRPTDQSYLRYFYKFHEYKDILIDPVPVNRWANKSIDVTLPGVFSGMMLAIYGPKSSRRIYMASELKKDIAEGKIDPEEVKQELYKIYGCIRNDGSDYNKGKIFKRKIDESVDVIFARIKEKSLSDEYITSGLNSIGFHVMNSLRDTEKQLLVEVN